LYITGWIGWAGRKYLRYASTTDNAFENEIIINVPVALSIMNSGFLWPIESWKEFTSGDLLEAVKSNPSLAIKKAGNPRIKIDIQDENGLGYWLINLSPIIFPILFILIFVWFFLRFTVKILLFFILFFALLFILDWLGVFTWVNQNILSHFL